MLKSNAARGVLVILLAVAFFELGVTGKVGHIWSLAFTGDPAKRKNPSAPSQPVPKTPGIPPVVIA